MFSFLDTRHPFVKHIHSLIDHYGIDQYGAIRGTTYKFINIDLHWNTYSYRTWTLFDSSDNVLELHQEWYKWCYSLFERADKLIKEARQRIKDEAIQERINSDIEKYLTSSSPLPEAMEDLKKMNYHKNEIIKLSKKWQDAIINIHQ